MNEFESALRAARRRQARFYLGGLLALAVIVAAVAGVLVATTATVIEVAPAVADATAAVRVAGGLSVIAGRTVYGLSRTPTVEVTAAGFVAARRTLAPEERGRTVLVQLRPLPGRIVAAAPDALADAGWRLDGRPAGTGPRLDREVAAGRHALTLEHAYFEPQTQEVEVGRGETRELAFDPEPVAGLVAIASVPEGAQVRIDGRSAGRTPLEAPLAGGSHKVEVTADGHLPVADEIRVTHAQPAPARRYVLEPQSATLVVAVAPEGGELLVGGRRAVPSQPVRVPAGEAHRVTYLRDGYRGEVRTVTLAPGETRELALALTPREGEVEIRTTPPARIRVDGVDRGEGSVVLTLAVVPHAVELSRPGYRTVTRTVLPTEGERVVLRETLTPETAARLAEAPRDYVNAAGIALVLFEPGPFVMGAPRHEEGQRANEFVRRVTLARPFYAARHEVTNAQFAMFRPGHGGAAAEPATGIAWEDAAAFADWLSAGEGLAPFYGPAGSGGAGSGGFDPESDGYRLLTEAEWEWLARRAGRARETTFPWGDGDVVPRGAGNIADEAAVGVVPVYVPGYNDGHARLAAVGSYPAGASGLFDLAGNVREWVHDWYSLTPPAEGAAFTDPLGPEFGDSHVVKGSSWRSGTRSTLRAAYRDGLSAGRDDVGFRIGRYLHAAGAPE